MSKGPPIDLDTLRAVDAIGRAVEDSDATFVGVVFARGGGRAVVIAGKPGTFANPDDAYQEAAAELWKMADVPNSLPGDDDEDDEGNA